MCLESTCTNSDCGKKTWWGCGCHIEAVMSKIPVEQACSCEKPRPSRPANAPAEKKHVHDPVE